MIQFLVGILMACIGGYALAAVFVPRWRACWKGTRVLTGAVSNLGLGLTFAATGVILMLAKDNKDPVILAIAGPPLLAGVPLVLVGNWLDFRRPVMSPPPGRKRRSTSHRA